MAVLEKCENVTFVPDVVKTYINSISNKPLLTFEEEQELAKQIADGNEQAKSKLIESNLRLVVNIAKTYVNHTSMSFIDIIQEGNVGLIKAAERFDYSQGYRFSTYATYWIKQAISKAIPEQTRSIRLPAHIINLLNKINKITPTLTQELKRTPTNKEIADKLGVPEEKVLKLLDITRETSSLDSTLSDEEEVTIGDLIADDNAQNFEILAEKEELSKAIYKVLDTLIEREQKVIIMRFGLDDGRPKTLDEIGKQLGLTRERVRQIENKALVKLRHPLRAGLLVDFI